MEYPAEIQTENQKAWYLKHFLGYSYEQIGKELYCSKSAVHKKLYKRQSVAVIYKKQLEFCKKECDKSVSECRDCMLYKFMLSKMMR